MDKKLEDLEGHINKGKSVFEFPGIKKVNKLKDIKDGSYLFINFQKNPVVLSSIKIDKFAPKLTDDEPQLNFSGGEYYEVLYRVDKSKVALHYCSPNIATISKSQVEIGLVYQF